MPEEYLRHPHRPAQLRVPEGEARLKPLRRRWLLCGLAITACAGVPFLAEGYGADPDAWLVARSAATLWTSGHYVVSRFPGYPLHEIACAPLVGLGGYAASNAGTLLAAFILVAFWFRIASRVARNPLTVFFSLVCAPLVLANVATTMDYLWSLAALMAALDAALDGRAIASGLLTGIAAGFRPSNLTIALPLFALVALAGGRSAGLRYLLAAGAAALTAFLPVLVTYGGPFRWFALTRADMGDVHPEFPDRVFGFLYRLVYAAGPLATVALAWALVTGRARLRKALRGGDPVVFASLIAVGIMTAQFFALPLERAYLLPALPFTLLLADRVSTPRMSLAVLLCIASLNLVNPDIITHQRSGKVAGLNIHGGRIQETLTDRRETMELEIAADRNAWDSAGRP